MTVLTYYTDCTDWLTSSGHKNHSRAKFERLGPVKLNIKVIRDFTLCRWLITDVPNVVQFIMLDPSTLEGKGSTILCSAQRAVHRRKTGYTRNSTRQFAHLFDQQWILVAEVCLCCDVTSLNTRLLSWQSEGKQSVCSSPRVIPASYTNVQLNCSYLGKNIDWEGCAFGCWG
jgi:hypothetical protein